MVWKEKSTAEESWKFYKFMETKHISKQPIGLRRSQRGGEVGEMISKQMKIETHHINTYGMQQKQFWEENQ